jgi:hypothetical protein
MPFPFSDSDSLWESLFTVTFLLFSILGIAKCKKTLDCTLKNKFYSWNNGIPLLCLEPMP